jgi:hypothetical protein
MGQYQMNERSQQSLNEMMAALPSSVRMGVLRDLQGELPFIHNVLHAERQRQIDLGYTDEHDDKNTPEQWQDYGDKYLHEAGILAEQGRDFEAYLQVIKFATIGVAWAEALRRAHQSAVSPEDRAARDAVASRAIAEGTFDPSTANTPR